VGVFTTFTLLGFLGYGMIKKTENIQHEYVTIKKEEAAMLNVLRIKKKQFNAFIELTQREMTGKDTEQLFEILDDAAQRNVIANVNRYLLEKELKEKKLNVVFQELSPSEIEVCRLILQKKKLTEICKILNKNESNVTTHRAHIRKKLGLEKTDDLYETLRQRMDMAVPAQP
jgi:DNA-binding CsgD family transcriptional regulator